MDDIYYAVIDPRDGYVEAYKRSLEEARAYAHFLESSSAHPYKSYGVVFKIKQIKN